MPDDNGGVTALDYPLEERLDELRVLIRNARTPSEARRWATVVRQLRLEAAGWEPWLRTIFARYFPAPFADFHEDFWRWVWTLELGERADEDYVGIWSRGFAKSTNVESACLALGARGKRRYGLYVCDTQDRADQHVGTTISGMFESEELERLYPTFSKRLLTKYGHSRGWKVNRLRTETGFTIDALGLDAAVRGVKIDEQRPDFIILDDIDTPFDTEATTRKKVETITRSILPAGSPDCVTMAMQNLIHPTGVFARLADLVPQDQPFAEFLARRRVVGPIPAADGLVIDRQPDPVREGRTRATIVAGTPRWPGRLGLEELQVELDDAGETAFLMEYQHNVDRLEGAMFTKVLGIVQRHTCDGIDAMHRLVDGMLATTVWCDPAVTDTDQSDSQGIQADGIAEDGTIYRFRSWEQRGSPRTALCIAIRWAYELGSGHVGVETDQGGDTWYDSFDKALEQVLDEDPELRDRPMPIMLTDKAGAGQGPKHERAQRMHADYERPGPPIVHVYGYPEDSMALDASLGRVFVRKPFDLADASYYSWKYLRIGGEFDTGLDAASDLGPIRRR